jgi:hypothetical protein
MNDAQSTVAGLKAQDCPGGGWTGQPADLDRATVADCLTQGVCGCIYGDAVQRIERMRAALEEIAGETPRGKSGAKWRRGLAMIALEKDLATYLATVEQEPRTE